MAAQASHLERSAGGSPAGPVAVRRLEKHLTALTD